jgi:hypothetical protein
MMQATAVESDPLSPGDPLSRAEPVSAAGQHIVLVGNISSEADEDILRNFFSFCGPVAGVELWLTGDGTKEGTVSFGTPEAQKTALLVDRSIVVDRPIRISKPAMANAADAGPGGAEVLPPAAADRSGSDTIAPSESTPAADGDSEEGSRQSYQSLSALVEAGWRLGQRGVDYVTAFEEQHGYGKKAAKVIGEAASNIRGKVHEVDEAHGISRSIGPAMNGVATNVRAFDEAHGISEGASRTWNAALETGKAAVVTATPIAVSTFEAVSHKTDELVQRARDDPTLQAVAEGAQTRLAEVGSWASASVSSTVAHAEQLWKKHNSRG